MIKVTIGKYKRQLPERFSDIKPRILLRLAPFIYQAKPDRIMALSLLTQVDLVTLNRISEDDRYLLIKIISFLFEPSSQQPMKSVTIKGVQYLLPDTDFNDVCLAEFAMAHVFFNIFVQTKDPQWLNRVFAELCRPAREGNYINEPNWNGSHRRPYVGKLAELNAPLFDKLKEEEKATLLNFYVGSKLAITRRYHSIFDPPTEEEEIPIAYDYKQDPFLVLINSLSKTGQYGDYEKTGHQNIHLVLLNLVQDKANAPKQPDHDI